MNSAKLEQIKTTRNPSKQFLHQPTLEEENRKLKQQVRYHQMELYKLRQQVYSLYQENIQLRMNGTSQNSFIQQCQAQIKRLKELVSELTDKRIQQPQDRQELKDRIILRLQDELLNTKIALREARIALQQK